MINKKLYLLVLVFNFINSQIKINTYKHNNFIEVEYINNNFKDVLIDDFVFLMIDKKCKDLGLKLSNESYKLDLDTLKINFNYYPLCSNKIINNINIKKLTLKNNDNIKKAFTLNKKDFNKINYIVFYYYIDNKEYLLLSKLINK